MTFKDPNYISHLLILAFVHYLYGNMDNIWLFYFYIVSNSV